MMMTRTVFILFLVAVISTYGLLVPSNILFLRGTAFPRSSDVSPLAFSRFLGLSNINGVREISGQLYASSGGTDRSSISSSTPLVNGIDISPGRNGSIVKHILRSGDPSVGHPLVKDSVEIAWRIFHTNGSLIHDSSNLDKPFDFRIGADPREVILGWEWTVKTMYLGELASVIIQPEFAFAEKGAPPMIAPNTTLMCELELLKISPSLSRRYKSVGLNESIREELIDKIQSGQTPLTEEVLQTDSSNDRPFSASARTPSSAAFTAPSSSETSPRPFPSPKDSSPVNPLSGTTAVSSPTASGLGFQQPSATAKPRIKPDANGGDNGNSGGGGVGSSSSSSRQIPIGVGGNADDPCGGGRATGGAGGLRGSEGDESARPKSYFDPSKHTLDPKMRVGGEGVGHTWEETASTIDVRVPVPATVDKNDLEVIISSKQISVRLISTRKALIQGPLHGKILPSESIWAIIRSAPGGTGSGGGSSEKELSPLGNSDGSDYVYRQGPHILISLEKAFGSKDIWTTVFDRSYIEDQAKLPFR